MKLTKKQKQRAKRDLKNFLKVLFIALICQSCSYRIYDDGYIYTLCKSKKFIHEDYNKDSLLLYAEKHNFKLKN